MLYIVYFVEKIKGGCGLLKVVDVRFVYSSKERKLVATVFRAIGGKSLLIYSQSANEAFWLLSLIDSPMEWDYTDSASTNEHETRSTLHELIKQEACGFFFLRCRCCCCCYCSVYSVAFHQRQMNCWLSIKDVGIHTNAHIMKWLLEALEQQETYNFRIELLLLHHVCVCVCVSFEISVLTHQKQ